MNLTRRSLFSSASGIAVMSLLPIQTACAQPNIGGVAMTEFDPDNPATMSVMPPDWVSGEKCVIHSAGNDRPWVILWGDSHAIQQLPALKQHCINANHNLVAYVGGLCPPYKPTASDITVNGNMNREALDFIATKRANGKRVTVVLGGFWHFYWTIPTTDPRYPTALRFRNGELGMFQQLDTLGCRVMPISQTPTIPLTMDFATAPDTLPRATMLPDEVAINNWLAARLGLFPVANRGYADIKDWNCTSTTGYVRVTGAELYYDNVHVNVNYTYLNQADFVWAVQ